MSVNLLLHNALSGLNTNQAALTQVSNNIANVNTEGYARRTIQQEAVSVAGQAAGVSIAEIRRAVDVFFSQQSIEATGDAGRYEAEARVHDRIQSMLGSPDDETTLSGRINTALTSVADVLIDPASGVRRADYLSDLDLMASSFASAHQQIETIRADVDQEIKTTVTEVNRLLERVDTLNSQIQREVFNGNDTTSLLDQRDVAIMDLGKLIDLKTQDQPDGTVHVSTGNGFPLVGNTRATLDYSNPGTVSSESTFPSITVTRQTATGVAVQNTELIEPNLSGGSLAGLLTMRDVDLPNLSRQIGELAGTITDQLNAVHNDSIAVPPPNTLTGRNTGLLATDAHGFTGDTTLAVIGADGTLTSRIDIDFDSNTLSVDGGAPAAIGTTIGSVVNAIDTALGVNGSASFANGVLTIDATNAAEGVGFLQDSADPSNRGGRGFSHFFGLNDLMTAHQPGHFDTGFVAASGHGFATGESVDITLRDGDGVVQQSATITMTAAGSIGDIVTALNTAMTPALSFSLDGNGRLVSTPAVGYENYSLMASNDSTVRGGTGVTVTDLLGLGGAPQMEQARDMAVVSHVASNTSRLSLAKLDIDGATAAGDVVATIGDNRGALALQAIQNSTVSFEAAGSIKATTSTIANFAGLVMAEAGSRAAIADSKEAAALALQTETDARKAEAQGVNMDEELSNMIIYQQAYNAAARMMSTSQELYDTLLRII